jgi:hypothetical protein
MTLTIEQAYELPRPEDIRAMGFVIKLKELAAGSPEVKKLVDEYVVTPAVAADLPVVFEKMKQVFDRGEEYGRFIHGSFGSGKSHFMTMLSLLLEGVGDAWQKDHPAFATLRTKHHGWVEDAHLLVVRIHMLSVKGKGTGLDRAVYDGFNEALRRRGKAPFEFLHVDGVLDEARREAQQYGDVFWKNLANAGVVASKDDFEAMAASKSFKQREALARAYLGYKGRDAASAGIDPKWSEGLRRMAEHAKSQGFGGVVLLIDEFLLWLGEKSGQEFKEAINDLNVIVDHNTGLRAVPLFVFVARQKDIREFFPDLVDESEIHDTLDHHAQRFEKTMLQDIELRHIVKERVLRAKAKDAIAEATARLAQDHEKILPALLSNVDLAYLKDVYPFHPALIEMLVDITALMQRERSALRLLYELLVIHYPTLPLGEFLPVGSAFDAIFPRGGVEASKKVEVLQDIHRQYYDRLDPAMRQMLAAGELDDKRHHALDQLVKTVLLAEVSPRLKGKGLTIERLVQLNSVDVEGETYRGRLRLAANDLVALSNMVPDLQVTSTDKTAIVRYVLGGVSLGEVLGRARSKVDNDARRFEVFYAALKEALGITNLRGFGEKEQNLGDYEIKWRNTRRKGTLRIANVRELSYGDFEAPDGAFTILVDYPWDEPGQSVEADRQKAIQVRSRGNKYTACWLPRHLSPSELSIITDLAAVRFLQSLAGQKELLDTLSPVDRGRLVDQAQGREKLLAEQLQDLLKKVYIEHGEFFPLISDIDTKRPYDELEPNLKHIAGLLMDRRYAHHPVFGAEPKKADLVRLLDWMVAAGDATTSVVFDDETERVLKTIGQPLELVNLGQTKASLRIDSRYIKDVLQRADKDVVNWSEVADALRHEYGFQPLILDLFLGFLCQRDHRALNQVSGEPIEVTIGMPASAAVRLERGKLVGPAEWSRLRELAVHMLELPQPPSQRSLQQQDKLAVAMRQRGIERRQVLSGVYQRLGHLGVESGDRRNEIATANERLAPLAEHTTDSFKVLTALLAKWPDQADDPLRAVVQGIEVARAALAQLDDRARDHLAKGHGHPTVGPLATEHLESLASYLSAASAERPITATWITTWNKRAQELIAQMISAPGRGPAPGPGPGPGPGPVPPKPPAPPPERILYNDVVTVGVKSAVNDALATIKAKLDAAPRGRVRVTITREDD